MTVDIASIKQGSHFSDLSPQFSVSRSILKLENLLDSVVNAHDSDKAKVTQFINVSDVTAQYPAAADLAYISATKMGKKTLLIDASNDAELIRRLISDYKEPADASDAGIIFSIRDTDLSLFSLPGRVKDRAISKEKIKNILDSLKGKFDVIIINSASPLIRAKTIDFSVNCDGVILALEAEKSRVPVINAIKSKLNDHDVNIIGTTLNNRKLYIPAFLYKLLFKS